MLNSYRNLPQLQSLVYFESAARLLNFTPAAEELGTTQPAISQRVRAMEEHLGVSLFQRLHRGVKLTHEGERLYQTVRDSLDALNQATAQVRPQEDKRLLTIATDFGFAKLWLMPRMHALRRLMPELQLRVLTWQDEIDDRRGEVDLHIILTASRHKGRRNCWCPKSWCRCAAPICWIGIGRSAKPPSCARCRCCTCSAVIRRAG